MHELAIAEALIEQVERELSRAGHPGPVVKLELAVGRLTGVHSDSLRFAFELLAPGTLLENAEVEIAQPKAACACRHCGTRLEIDEIVLHCPKCQSNEIVIEGGRDLLLESIEVAD
ncbi:MAG: hydrogenase maturation nickel metallochaperone HypA [Planctomycetota bacterium]